MVVGVSAPYRVEGYPSRLAWYPRAISCEVVVEIPTGVCVVRSYRPGDAASLAQYANNRKVWLNLRDRFPHPFSVADGAAYIGAVLARPRETSFAITVNDVAVGGISLRIGEDIERLSAELGYWLGESHWGRGIATAAVGAVTQYGFEALGLMRIFAVPYATNPASCRVLEKAGYVREGVMRASAIKDGKLLDQVLYARISLEPPGDSV